MLAIDSDLYSALHHDMSMNDDAYANLSNKRSDFGSEMEYEIEKIRLNFKSHTWLKLFKVQPLSCVHPLHGECCDLVSTMSKTLLHFVSDDSLSSLIRCHLDSLD